MSIDFSGDDVHGDLWVDDRNTETDTMIIGTSYFQDAVAHELTRDEALSLWQHLGEQFGFSS